MQAMLESPSTKMCQTDGLNYAQKNFIASRKIHAYPLFLANAYLPYTMN